MKNKFGSILFIIVIIIFVMIILYILLIRKNIYESFTDGLPSLQTSDNNETQFLQTEQTGLLTTVQSSSQNIDTRNSSKSNEDKTSDKNNKDSGVKNIKK